MKNNVKGALYSILLSAFLVILGSLEISKNIKLGYERTLHLESLNQKISVFVCMTLLFYFMIFKKNNK